MNFGKRKLQLALFKPPFYVFDGRCQPGGRELGPGCKPSAAWGPETDMCAFSVPESAIASEELRGGIK